MNRHEMAQPKNSMIHGQTVALLFAVALVGSNAFVLSPVLSEVAKGLGTEPFRIAWAISAFGAATAFSSLLLSPLIDILGARFSLAAAAALLSLAQFLSMLSQSWLWLCAAQALAGIAVGVLLPGTYATTAATSPPGRETARLGIVLTGWALSLVLAVPLAALITQHFGWRIVYACLASLSAVTAFSLYRVIASVDVHATRKTSVWTALRLPGIAVFLLIEFGFMTAFYGTFAFFGLGVRNALNLSAQQAGLYVLAYGLGFGLAGLLAGRISFRVTHMSLTVLLVVISGVYFIWHLVLFSSVTTFATALFWGFFNQFALNALVVSLNRRAQHARGAVMGLNSAVTYAAVFAGPVVMGPAFIAHGFPLVTMLDAVFAFAGAMITFIFARHGH